MYDTWIKGYADAPRLAWQCECGAKRRWPYEIYETYQRAVIDRLLARAQLIVARPDDWPEGIQGWLCAEQQPSRFVAHFAVTKPHLRRQGILTALLEHLRPTGRLVFSHFRPPFTDTLRRRGYAHDGRAIENPTPDRRTHVRDP